MNATAGMPASPQVDLAQPRNSRIESLLVQLDDAATIESGGIEVRISFAGETTLEDAVSHYLAARENFTPPRTFAESRAEVA